MNSIRSYALWVLPCAVLVLAVLFLADNSSGFFENGRHRTFNKEEIQKMEQTTAIIETKFGDITLKFFPEVAPNHVNSFIQLAKDGFYDGTIFHRVVPGFVIQGGDPNTKSDDRSRHGTGGPGFTLKAEFSKLPHKRGTLSMARAADPDSAGSQFFICVADAPFLDGEYTVFGEVVEGMDVVDKIVSQPKDQRDNPVDRVEMKVKIEEQGTSRRVEDRGQTTVSLYVMRY
jgi:cyclophilin family peptidyl-prolyl cis-trans isomerase